MNSLERKLNRIVRDAEISKLQQATVLGGNRALTLLATGDRIFVDPRDMGCGLSLLSEGKYEQTEIRLFRRYLHPGAIVLDIGANYGYYSILSAGSVRPNGKVIAFEPNPHIHALFRSSVYLNGLGEIVEAHCLAAYDANNALQFEICEQSPGGAHVVAPSDRPPPEHLVIDVPVVKLDDFLPGDIIVNLVKIDVEGHEEHVLRGMASIIGRSPDIVIFLEFIHDLFKNREEFQSYCDLVEVELGLHIYRIMDGGSPSQVRPRDLAGESCTLILSKQLLLDRPDLIVVPDQMHKHDDTFTRDDGLAWQPRTLVPREITILHGPYAFLEKGLYELKIDAVFAGDFIIRVQENYGDVLWEANVRSSCGLSTEISLSSDAPRLELVIIARVTEASELLFRSAEFWRKA